MKRAVLLIVASALVFGAISGQARAGVITYDIQSDPQADRYHQNGYTVMGTITINADYLGIISSLGPIYPGTPSPIVGWSYSIYDYTGTLVNFSSSTDPGSFTYQDGGGSILATSTSLVALGRGGPIDFLLYDSGSWLEWAGVGSNAEFIGELPGSTIWAYQEPFVSLPDGSSGTLIGVAAAVPEPSSILLGGFGVLALVGYRWSYHRQATNP